MCVCVCLCVCVCVCVRVLWQVYSCPFLFGAVVAVVSGACCATTHVVQLMFLFVAVVVGCLAFFLKLLNTVVEYPALLVVLFLVWPLQMMLSSG